jgi:hypothetical protein
MDLTEATTLASTFLVAGFSEIYFPKAGALWVPSPDLILGPFPVDGNGEFTLDAHWPSLPVGVSVALQFWTQEGGSALSASNGLRITQL